MLNEVDEVGCEVFATISGAHERAKLVIAVRSLTVSLEGAALRAGVPDVTVFQKHS